ncbi:MAG: hypothetical protein GXY67_02410 [Clostridiales bacterium]|nr:hypothetical protein [Clostridiales bacterium]
MQHTANQRGAGIAGNLDTSFLKVLALLFMVVDHIGAAVFTNIPELRVIGRMAFPLYAWCLVVGSEKTRSPLHYGLRLLLVGIIAQPLYMMALSHTWQDLNILFSLLVGLIAIQGIQKRWMFSQIWVPALCYVLLGFIHVDYGWMGLTFILVLYGARNNRSGLVAAYLAFALFWGTGSNTVSQLFGWKLPFLSWPGLGPLLTTLFRTQGMVWLSLPLIALPTHTRLRMPQWLGYALYPAHLVLIIVLKVLVNGAGWATLLRGF